MTLSSDQRRNMVLGAEGNVLEHAARHGADNAASYARCWIDGNFNALIRIEGSECAAEFAFSVSDRVCAGLRKETEPPPAPPAAPPAAADEKKRRSVFTPWCAGYCWGFVHGAALAVWLIVVLGKTLR